MVLCYPSFEAHSVFMLRWILEWFHMVIISMHDRAAAPCSLVVRLWLSLVIELCADSESVVTGFKNRKVLFSAQMWQSLVLSAGKWRTWVQKLWNKGGTFREESWFGVFFFGVQRFSLFQVMTQHHGSILGLPWHFTPKRPKASSDERNVQLVGNKHNIGQGCIEARHMYIYSRFFHVVWNENSHVVQSNLYFH